MTTETISLRRFLKDSSAQQGVSLGRRMLVTYRGKPYFEVSPARTGRSFFGAGKHLAKGEATDGKLPASVWGVGG